MPKRQKWGGVAQSFQTLCDPIDVACQASLSMGFSRQEFWSGLPLPSPQAAEVRFNPGTWDTGFVLGFCCCCCSVTKLRPPRGLQHARLRYLVLSSSSPLSPQVCSNLCPLSGWCSLTISSFAFNLSQHPIVALRLETLPIPDGLLSLPSRDSPISWGSVEVQQRPMLLFRTFLFSSFAALLGGSHSSSVSVIWGQNCWPEHFI